MTYQCLALIPLALLAGLGIRAETKVKVMEERQRQ